MALDSYDQRADLLAKLVHARASLARVAKSRETAELAFQNARHVVARLDQQSRAAREQGRDDTARQLLAKKVAGQKKLDELESELHKVILLHETLKQRMQLHEAQVERIIQSWQEGPITERQARQWLANKSQPSGPRTQIGVRATLSSKQAAPQQVMTAEPKAKATVPPLASLLAQLDALTGLGSVKANVRQLIDMNRVAQMRIQADLPVSQVSRHLVFTGNPGTGKTTVARLVAQLYAAIGILEVGQLVEVSRTDLIAGYVGQTAIKTTEVVKRALGGVLFIDEAYALTRTIGSGQDFGQEAVDTLAKLMEDNRDNLVVIVAGYGEEMNQFIQANPGLPSRFPRTIHFPDYTTDELVTIFTGMCTIDQYEPTPLALGGLREYLTNLPRTRGFGNGRLVRNTFEAALARQASRIVATSDPNLTSLTLSDLGLSAPSPPTGSPLGGSTPGSAQVQPPPSPRTVS